MFLPVYRRPLPWGEGGVCTQALIVLVFINMNSLSYKWSYMHLLSSISAWFHLYALHGPVTHMLYPHLRALSFSYIRPPSNVDFLFHLYALPFTYTPLSLHQCALLFTFQQFSSAIRACLLLYALAFTYVQFSDRAFSDCRILIGHILRRLCCNFCCKSMTSHEYKLALKFKIMPAIW